VRGAPPLIETTARLADTPTTRTSAACAAQAQAAATAAIQWRSFIPLKTMPVHRP
jgi:hypothetical protein